MACIAMGLKNNDQNADLRFLERIFSTKHIPLLVSVGPIILHFHVKMQSIAKHYM